MERPEIRAEIWRHEWEIAQNNALEAAGRAERIDMRSYERQGITDLEPQIHLGPEVAALERKGIPTTRGEHNREIKHVNALIRGLQKTIAALGEWLQGIKETLSRHETISNPDDYNLGEVLLSYLELRKADREFWAHRAQTKASLKDLQAILNAISFLKERELDTVHSLGEYLSRIDTQMNELRKEVRGKEQRIRDIDALPSRTENNGMSILNTMEVFQNQNELNVLLEQTANYAVSPQQNEATLHENCRSNLPR